MKQKDLDQSRDLLLSCLHPLLVTHVAPDGDAAGSLLGLGWTLRALSKKPTLACSDPLPHRLDFLPGFHEVTDRPEGRFDLLISLDCSDASRMGQIGSHPGVEQAPLLNVDHHVTNLEFGTVNLVDVEAASTTHILYRLYRHLGLPLEEKIATCLLTGLVTDTRGFRTANVTPDVLRVAVELMEAGASLPTITRNGLDRRPLGTLLLWGAALSRLEAADGVVWTSVPLAVQRIADQEGHVNSGLANLLVGVEEAQVAVVFTEQADGQVEVGFRAVPGFDVARVALALGGGGHALASGTLVPGPLEEAQRRVLTLLREDLAGQRRQTLSDGGRHPQP